MTLEFFNGQMDRLAGLRYPPLDMTTHWEALQDMPAHVLSAAVTHAQKTRVEFPTPVELRRDADAVKPRTGEPDEDRYVDLETPVAFTVPVLADMDGEVFKPKAIVIEREWKFYCDACNDSGRRSVWCGGSKRWPWMETRKCANKKCERIREGMDTYGHEWVFDCPCVDWNPEIKKRKERDAQYAAAEVKRR